MIISTRFFNNAATLKVCVPCTNVAYRTITMEAKWRSIKKQHPTLNQAPGLQSYNLKPSDKYLTWGLCFRAPPSSARDFSAGSFIMLLHGYLAWTIKEEDMLVTLNVEPDPEFRLPSLGPRHMHAFPFCSRGFVLVTFTLYPLESLKSLRAHRACWFSPILVPTAAWTEAHFLLRCLVYFLIQSKQERGMKGIK